jgi:hypothetical protein
VFARRFSNQPGVKQVFKNFPTSDVQSQRGSHTARIDVKPCYCRAAQKWHLRSSVWRAPLNRFNLIPVLWCLKDQKSFVGFLKAFDLFLTTEPLLSIFDALPKQANTQNRYRYNVPHEYNRARYEMGGILEDLFGNDSGQITQGAQSRP